MGHVVYTALANGMSADGNVLDSIHDAFAAAINGGLDATNWAAGQIFSLYKVSGEGALSGQVPMWDSVDSRWEPVFPGLLLGVKQHNPTTVASPSTTSTSLVALDTTNLRLTVTPRRTGNLLFVVSAVWAAAPNEQFMGILEAAATVVEAKSTGSSQVRNVVLLYKTGVSLAAHTYDLAQRSRAGTSVSVTYGTQASPANTDPGPITFAVLEMP